MSYLAHLDPHHLVDQPAASHEPVERLPKGDAVVFHNYDQQADGGTGVRELQKYPMSS